MSQRKIFNLIPEMPINWKTGNPAPWRECLGYSWQDLVISNHKVDHSSSTPGDDRKWIDDSSMQIIIDELITEHGNDLVFAEKGVVFCDTTKDGVITRESLFELDTIAIINRMWCGGTPITVYRGTPVYKEPQVEQGYVRNPAYANMSHDEIKQAEVDYDNLHNEGSEGYNPYRDNLFI